MRGQEPAPMQLREAGPCVVEEPLARPGAARERGVEDECADGRHGRRIGTVRRARTVRAVIGLGANVGDAAATIRDAIHALDALPGARVLAVSRLYATEPVGVTDQPEFRNAVALVDVPAGKTPEQGALDLLVALKGLERRFGRRRRRRWGPREIDLDLEAFGPYTISVERPPEGQSLDIATKGVKLLVVPHPSAAARLFVLAPWADVAPEEQPPGWPETVGEAAACQSALEGPAAVRPIAAWDARTRDWAPIP
jgi:2-amino-4-hydroxy-6-hydroxymethyldihydropteridine diphosphokinase